MKRPITKFNLLKSPTSMHPREAASSLKAPLSQSTLPTASFPLLQTHIYLVLFITKVIGTFASLGTNLFVILLESSKILTSLGELAFFHAFTDIPMNKGTLGVHQVKLVVNTRKSLGNCGCVGNHADSTLDIGKIATGNDGRRLVVDSALESGRAPIDKLDRALGLDGRNSSVDILGNNVTTVHEAACHVLSVTRITLGHHAGGFKDRTGDIGNRKLFVVGLFRRNDGGIRGQHEVNTRVRDQVGLELCHIHIKSSIET
mmetsp:Transcript_21448/g.38928  ORF Transcript_21448/g.38928 Transcript_21448/m.38928 type:complete len:259 (+) Transcript_21448:17-793(+)